MSKYLYLLLNAKLSDETIIEIYPSLIHNIEFSLYDQNFDEPLLTYNKDIESFHKKGTIYQNWAEDMDQDIYNHIKSYHDTHGIILVTENAEVVTYSLKNYLPKMLSCLYHKSINLDSIRLLFNIDKDEYDYKHTDNHVDEFKYYLKAIKNDWLIKRKENIMKSTKIWLFSTIGDRECLYNLLKNIPGVSHSQLHKQHLSGPYYNILNLKELHGLIRSLENFESPQKIKNLWLTPHERKNEFKLFIDFE